MLLSAEHLSKNYGMKTLLEDASIWGVDLKAAGLSALVVEDFNRLNQGPGALRATLEQLRKG